ncbi:MAG TPA: TatD family hydrolase [Pyrinomonadaceae bacterium]|jgi:TatD DNase family protein|nr:TatD family hydrolase [Pyrinomonadaceae bacterium]
MFVDSHAHLDGPEYDADRDEVLERARGFGVRAFLTVGTGEPHGENFARARRLAEAHPDVYFAVGVHPHDARHYDEAAGELIRSHLTSGPKAVGLGEIGLDYHYDHSPREIQRDAFVRQLNLARELRLPVIIHSREADEETVKILADHWTEPPRPGLMHCFGGGVSMAEQLLARGFYFSFAGNVTFKKAETLREAARLIPLDRLLIETDCPYLSPVPLRGKRNEPAHVVHTARFLAELKGLSLAELAQATTRNFAQLFHLNISC